MFKLEWQFALKDTGAAYRNEIAPDGSIIKVTVNFDTQVVTFIELFKKCQSSPVKRCSRFFKTLFNGS